MRQSNTQQGHAQNARWSHQRRTPGGLHSLRAIRHPEPLRDNDLRTEAALRQRKTTRTHQNAGRSHRWWTRTPSRYRRGARSQQYRLSQTPGLSLPAQRGEPLFVFYGIRGWARSGGVGGGGDARNTRNTRNPEYRGLLGNAQLRGIQQGSRGAEQPRRTFAQAPSFGCACAIPGRTQGAPSGAPGAPWGCARALPVWAPA